MPIHSQIGSLVAWTGAAVFLWSLLYAFYSYVVRFVPAPTSDGWASALAVNVLLFSAFALHHSVLARARWKQRLITRVGARLERPVYVWVASLLFLACCALWQLLPGRLYQWSGLWIAVPVGLQGAGAVLTALAARRLDVMELAGLRQPAPAIEPRALETDGTYGLVRHPIYLGWVLLMAGAIDMTWTRACFAAVSIGYLVIAVPFEERGLLGAYGDSYRRYQRAVRWRIVPGVY
jgi:protein-S-isoprenylcysteine O-methyltransferase Ste14